MQTDPCSSSRSPRRGALATSRALRWLGVVALTVAGLATLVGSGGGGGGDDPAPGTLTVVGTTPTNGATGVPVGGTLSATFSENLANNPTFTVTAAGGGAVTGVVTRAGSTATFTPAAPLAFSTNYTASVSAGSGASGAAQSGSTSWSFRTAADPLSPPQLSLGANAVTFSGTVGGADPAAQTVAIDNAGGGTLSGLAAAVASYGAGATGWLATVSLDSTTAPALLTVRPATGALAAGTYTAVVNVTAVGAQGTPAPVNVTFTVAAPAAVTITGTADFASVPNDTATDGGLVYGSATFKPIRGATVEVLPAAGGAALATGTTSATGTYSLTLAAVQPVIVRVRAELLRQGQASGGNWNFTVRDNTQGNAVYVLDSPAFTPATGANTRDLRALSGWGGSSYTTTRAAGPFAILDVVHEATQKVLTASPNASFPSLHLMWSVNNQPARNDNDLTDGLIGTSFYQFDGTQHRIYILGAANTDTDEYDRTVVAHEFGHYFQSVFSRDDSIGGSHGSQDKLDMRVAFSEGWGNAWAGMALATSLYADSLGAGQQSGFVNNLAASPAAGQRGWYSEASVQYLMFQWHGAAGIGFTPVFNVLAGMRSGLGTDGALSSIHYFAHKLKQAVQAQAAAIDTALAGQSITVADALGSTEGNNGGIADALPIYKQHTAGLGAAQNYCVTDIAEQGGVEFNKLAAQAFIRLTLPASGARTIAVTSSQAGSDPGFRLVTPAGAESEHDDSGSTSESTTIGSVSAGTYLVVLYDWNLTHGATSGTVHGRKCFNVTVNQ